MPPETVLRQLIGGRVIRNRQLFQQQELSQQHVTPFSHGYLSLSEHVSGYVFDEQVPLDGTRVRSDFGVARRTT